MTTIRTRLVNTQQANGALNAIYRDLKPYLLAEHQFEVLVTPAKRTEDQSAKFHAICGDIAKSGATWAGKVRDAAAWKVLLVSGHSAATNEGCEIVPGIEGELVNIRESTALMSKKRSSSLIEYTLAWCAAEGIRLPATEYESEP